MSSKAIGSLVANPLAIEGWRPNSDETIFQASELALLSEALDFEGGALTPAASGQLMVGQYVVDWNLGGFTLPPIDTHQDYEVVPYVYITSRGSSSIMRPLTYNPIPSNVTQGKVRLFRSGGTPLVIVDSLDGPQSTFTLTSQVSVVRLFGVVICRRWYWSACEVYD
jgi:hypothetical protein